MSNQIDQVIEQATTQLNTVVGTVVLVSHQGKLMYHRAAGYADRENQQVMQENAIFRLASVTKPFTAAAVGILLQQNRLSLADPVTKWLPDFQPKLADGRQPVITVGQLLTHTAGLNYRAHEDANGPYHQHGVSDGLDLSGLSLAENLQRIAAVPLLYEPGHGFQYSIATDVLGAVLERVCHQPLGELMRELVTDPLGMKDTGFSVTDPTRLVVPYVDHQPIPRRMQDDDIVPMEEGAVGFHFSPQRVFDPTAFPSAGAGMVGTASDVLRLFEAFCTPKANFLSRETLALLMQDCSGDVMVNPGWGFAAGWPILRDPIAADTPQSVGSISWGGVYGGHWFVDFKRQLVTLILTNTAYEGTFGAFTVNIRDAVYTSLNNQ